jgi:hypothetical protein
MSISTIGNTFHLEHIYQSISYIYWKKMNFKNLNFNYLKGFLLIISMINMGMSTASAQQQVQLSRLQDFQPNSGTWQEAAKVSANPDVAFDMKAESGSGILVNLPTKKNQGQDLVSKEAFGDIDFEAEIMVASKSNSGIYLMGQYEIQILDSWTKTTVKSGDMGGIYERWDESKPEGQKGYSGYAPRQNATRAPGVWQQLKVSFQAPRFNAQGEKTQNAKFISVHLNGVLLHENLEVFGPTRGSMKPDEVAQGPIRIQGDHGPVALRNIKITRFDSALPTIGQVEYELYKGMFNQIPEFAQLQPISKGSLTSLQEQIPSPAGQNMIRYKGNLQIPQSGKYKLQLQVPSGMGALTINGQKLIDLREGLQQVEHEFGQGAASFEILVSKTKDWSETGLDLSISGPGLRDVYLAKSDFTPFYNVDPILVGEKDNRVLRSFMDLPDGKRITHAISVSSPQKVHYAFDLSKGNLALAWRGEFLDATPMWHDRGNGVSRPWGAVVFLGNPDQLLQGTEFQSSNRNHISQGYELKENSIEYKYESQGITFTDIISSRQDGKGLDRRLLADGPTSGRKYTIAEAGEIKLIRDGLYLIADRGYYIQIDPKATGKPTIQQVGDLQQLTVGITQPLSYSLLF